MKQLPVRSEKAVPVVSYKQLLRTKSYRVNPDGSITFKKEHFDSK